MSPDGRKKTPQRAAVFFMLSDQEMLGAKPSPVLLNLDPSPELHGGPNPPVNQEEVANTSSQPDQDPPEAMDTRTAAAGQGNAGHVADTTGKAGHSTTTPSILKKLTFEVPTVFQFSERATFSSASTAPSAERASRAFFFYHLKGQPHRHFKNI